MGGGGANTYVMNYSSIKHNRDTVYLTGEGGDFKN